jgi:hypothetical protein
LVASLCVCLHLWVLCIECCCCYICSYLSSSNSDRVVDTLPNYSFPLFAELFPWKRVLLTLQRRWLHCCGNVFIRPLLSIGCLLSCDWLAPELMWAVPTYITDQRIFIVETNIRKRTCVKCKERFILKYPASPMPMKSCMFRVIKKWQATRSVPLKHDIARKQCSQMRSLKTFGRSCRLGLGTKMIITRDVCL